MEFLDFISSILQNIGNFFLNFIKIFEFIFIKLPDFILDFLFCIFPSGIATTIIICFTAVILVVIIKPILHLISSFLPF